MDPPPPSGPARRGARPFPSAALNTYALPGVHGTRRRWALEAGRNVGLAVAVLAPLVGLCVVTPLIALVAGVGGEARPGWPCLKTEAEACPTPIQFDYYFWNVTNAVEWMAGAPPVVQELGPYAFRARELRWNARWSPDQVNVTFTRTFYHESYLPAASCPSCSLDDAIVTVNRGYLAVLASTGGTELPFVLGGVPTALAAALSAFEAGLIAGGAPPAVAPALARRQWAACDVWPADPVAGVEWCAVQGAAQNVPPGSPSTTLDDPTAALLLTLLLGNASRADAGGSDPAARATALFVGLLPPASVAAALGVPVALATAAQTYVRSLAVALVGPAYVASMLGPPLGPSSGGVVVARSARDWLAGWPDPLLSAVAPGPRATVSAAFAWPAATAVTTVLGKSIDRVRGGDHPLVTDVTATTGEPRATVDAANGVFSFQELPPWRTLAVDGSTAAVAGAAADGAAVAVAGALDGVVLGERVKSRNQPLTVFDATLRRPLAVVPLDAANETELASSSSHSPRVKGVAVHSYGIAPASAAACAGGAGGVDRCAAPDAYAWAWRADGLYGTATQISLPRFYKADALAAASLAPLPPPVPALHAWTMQVEPFMGRAIAASKPFQVAHRVAPTDVTARRLGGRAAARAAPAAWLPTHWVRASYTLSDGDAAKMRDGLAVVAGMRVGMSWALPAAGVAVAAVCIYLLHLSPDARAVAAAAKLVAEPRPMPTNIEGAAVVAAAVEAGASGGVGGEA